MRKKFKRQIVANWIRFEQISEDEYIVRDLLFDEEDEEDCILSADIVQFAKKLDGKTDPYDIDKSLSRSTVNTYMNILDASGIIRDRIFYSKSILGTMITLWHPENTMKFRMVSLVLNTLLMVSFLPVFILSVVEFIYNSGNFNMDFWIAGIIVSIPMGMVMHEMAHLWACLGYGGQAFEVGLFFQMLIPGAYVMIKDDNIKKRLRRVQVSAAGVEMNFLLTGISVLLACKFPVFSGFFMGAAVQNLLMALTNLTFIKGFDGMTIIGELIGDKMLCVKIKDVIKNPIYKKYLKKQGLKGWGIIAVSYILSFSQLALPLLYLLNIGAVIV